MNRLVRIVVVLATLLVWISLAPAQLRIVDYNTHDGPNPGMATVFEAIGAEVSLGFAKPPDIFALQEQLSWSTTTQDIASVLNSIELFDNENYVPVQLDGATTGGGGGRPGLIYNTQTVDLISAVAFGTTSTSAQARQTLRYQFRPIGYDESADFYVYSNHYKSGATSTDRARRNVEATTLRADLNALGEGTHAILAGDYNIQSSNEASYQTLLSAGAGEAAYGQAFDPIHTSGNWNNNADMKLVHTQAPSSTPPSGFTGGGMDDRFDFQLVTAELLDGEGLSYMEGSYHAFGNNGTHECCNADITTGSGASPDVLSALTTASDHLPVIADYQLPAVMEVVVAEIPTTLELGKPFALDVLIRNAASVLVPLGADELDYELSTSGSVVGSAIGTQLALADAATQIVELDTSTLGIKSGEIIVSTTSQGVPAALVTIPVMYEVVSALLTGDYNRDGFVGAADYTVWRDTLGFQGANLPADGNGDLVVSAADYQIWTEHFVATSPPISEVVVPEPNALRLVLLAFCIIYAADALRERKRQFVARADGTRIIRTKVRAANCNPRSLTA